VYAHYGGLETAGDHSVFERYVTSLYYCYATMTTVGYGDVAATTWAEQVGDR
jgi:hypothetical protein